MLLPNVPKGCGQGSSIRKHPVRAKGLPRQFGFHHGMRCGTIAAIPVSYTHLVAPSKKYESEGGLGLHQLFAVLRGAFIERPIVAANAVIQWVVLSLIHI